MDQISQAFACGEWDEIMHACTPQTRTYLNGEERVEMKLMRTRKDYAVLARR